MAGYLNEVLIIWSTLNEDLEGIFQHAGLLLQISIT